MNAVGVIEAGRLPELGHAEAADAVTAHAREVLASFKRPKYVVFANQLPKNPSGKILKKDLRVEHADLANEV